MPALVQASTGLNRERTGTCHGHAAALDLGEPNSIAAASGGSGCARRQEAGVCQTICPDNFPGTNCLGQFARDKLHVDVGRFKRAHGWLWALSRAPAVPFAAYTDTCCTVCCIYRYL